MLPTACPYLEAHPLFGNKLGGRQSVTGTDTQTHSTWTDLARLILRAMKPGITVCLLAAFLPQVLNFGDSLVRLRVLRASNTLHRLADGTCCTGIEPPTVGTPCPHPCRTFFRACALPACQFTQLQRVSEKRGSEEVAIRLQGGNKLLLELWHLPTPAMALKPGERSQLIARVPTDFQAFPGFNKWTVNHAAAPNIFMDFAVSLQCEGTNEGECIMPEDDQQHSKDNSNLAKRISFSELSDRISTGGNKFQNMFGSFVSKFSGFSSRISNIVSLLDVMRRILTYMF